MNNTQKSVNTAVDKAPARWLVRELTRRQIRNGSYSLRCFARDLNVSSGSLSAILNGKRAVGRNVSKRISDRLGLSQNEYLQFLMGVEQGAPEKSECQWQELPDDQFRIISDWEHYAILSLIKTEDFKYDSQWIGNRLGISHYRVAAAIERLLRVRLVEESGNTLVRLTQSVTTTRDVPSTAIRESHRQILEQSIQSIDGVSLELRDLSSVTLPVDMSNIPAMKEVIREFRRSFFERFTNGELKEVYNLCIQLVPVSVVRSQKNNLNGVH